MAFITIDGQTKIAFQQGNGLLLNITHFVLANIAGLGAEPGDRIEAMPGVGDIVDTRVVTKSGYVNSNQVVYSLALDSTIGDYDFNWVGLKDEDDVLIAVLYLADPISKIASSGGVEGNNLIRNFLLQYSGIQATTAISAPADTWQIDFTTRLLQIDERERLSNLDIYGHEGFFDTAFSVERVGATSTYDVLAGIGYVGGVRVESLATQQVVSSVLPEAIWLDVSLQGDINGVDVVWELLVDSAAHPDYTDGLGFKHYLTKLADLDASGIATDSRIDADLYLLKSDVVSQAVAEAGTSTTARAWTAQRVKQAIIAVVKSATETVSGIAEVATQAETNAGTDDERFVTPKKLLWGFSILLATNGYIVFPSWLGGLIFQWFKVPPASYSTPMLITSKSWPIAFVNNVFMSIPVIINDGATGGAISAHTGDPSLSGVDIYIDNAGIYSITFGVFVLGIGN